MGAFNLSSKSFDQAALQVLNAGLKFVPTATRATADSVIQQQVERFARRVRLGFQFNTLGYDSRYHVPKPAFQPEAAGAGVEAFLDDVSDHVQAFFEKQQHCRPKTNLGPAQRRALQALRTDPDIIVKPSDKNLGLCILDKADYEALLLKELNDIEQFKLVLDPAEQVIRALVTRFKGILSLWRRDLPAHVFRYFEHWAKQAHLFPHPYVLPKLHKLPEVTREQLPNLKGRLIVPSHSWVTYAASVWLADVLHEACKNRYDHVLPDSRTLIRKLEGVQVSCDAFLVTFDVVAMYPSIDNEEAIEAACEVVKPALRGVVYDLLHFVMDNSFCIRGEKVHQQIHGTAMGTPCAVDYANIYVARCIEDVMRREFPNFPQHYFRLIDDGFFVWEGPADALHAFLQRMHSLLPNINLTWSISDVRVAFLDLWVSKDMGSAVDGLVPIKFSTFQKAHNKYMYVPFSSHHRPSVFRALIRGELIRYAVTNSNVADYEAVAQLFEQRVLKRGYPEALFVEVANSVAHADRLHYLIEDVDTEPPTSRSGPVFVASYGPKECTGGLSTIINQVYAAHKAVTPELEIVCGDHITVAYKNAANLSKLLVHAKD